MNEVPVKVAIRARPLLPRETEEELSECCVHVMPDTAQVVVGAEKGFTFDYAFGPTASQKELYTTCVKDLVAKVMSGSNCSVLVYGQTGSGKTYTMGTEYGLQSRVEHCGILPRVVDDVFRSVQSAQLGEWTLKVSFLEIYNECAYDLLTTTKHKEPLAIRDTGKLLVIPGLELVTVENVDSALACLERGCQTRSTGATWLNATSSRSHAIFTLHLQCLIQGTVLESKLQLVDLAGSETVKKTHSVGDRRKEGVNINLGLLALGNVINGLCSDPGKSPYICYRGSTLTRLLKDTLNGENLTVMIACISPATSNIVETVNTLRFADRARQIKTKPLVCRSNRGAKTASAEVRGESKRSRAYRRAVENVPPTPASWRLATPCPKTPLHWTRNEPPSCHLESTLLECTERDSGMASFVRQTPLASTVTPVRQNIPITPLVERMCSRLEKSVFKSMVQRLEQCATRLKERAATEAVEADVPLTPEQRTLLSHISSNIESAKKSLIEKSVPEADSASPVLRPGSERSVVKTPKATSAIAHRTRRRTTVFVGRVCDSPRPLPAKRGRKSVACTGCGPGSKKWVAPATSDKRAQRAHNKKVLSLLNSGCEKELRALSCVGPKTAKILSLHTQLRGKFDSLEALKTVPGLGTSFFQRFTAANVVTL